MKLKQPKKGVTPVASTNQVVMFISESRFDTPLDKIEIQIERILKWCKEQNLNVVDKITANDSDVNKQIDKALRYAKDYSGRVVIASPCRVAHKAIEFLKIRKNQIAPLTVIDYDNLWLKGEALDIIEFTLSVNMAMYEKYHAECKIWLA